LIGQNPYQQSIADNEFIVDKVVLIDKDPNYSERHGSISSVLAFTLLRNTQPRVERGEKVARYRHMFSTRLFRHTGDHEYEGNDGLHHIAATHKEK
jgi:hypothetical protein